MHATLPLLQNDDFPPIRRAALDTLQVNLGYRCNQQCAHCHVNAGPKREEMMAPEIIDDIIAFLRAGSIRTLDLTGGAPEMHPHFRRLVSEAAALGVHTIDRCNLTILSEPGHGDLADFLAAHRVEIVASLPCYLEKNVDSQRGKGVFARSIAGLRQLNRLGYGDADSGLVLNLVYNPQGPSLPPPQASLESDYKNRLGDTYGVRFNNLYTIANMPIQRFGSTLVTKGGFDAYLQVLKDAHRPENLAAVMCRGLISVDWRGRVFDCDFNQMLQLPAKIGGRPVYLRELQGRDISGEAIAVADHCYGCTAGQGSGCGGSLA